MSGDDVKAAIVSGFNLNTIVLIIGLVGTVFGFGVTWQKQVNATEAQKEAIAHAVEQTKVGDAQATTTAHAEVESVRTDLAREHDEVQKWISQHEATGRDRLAANSSVQSRLDAEIEAVRKDSNESARKIDQHEYRLTNAESQISQVRQTLDKITEKIDAIDRNVLLLAQRAGVQPDDAAAAPKQGARR